MEDMLKRITRNGEIGCHDNTMVVTTTQWLSRGIWHLWQFQLWQFCHSCVWKCHLKMQSWQHFRIVKVPDIVVLIRNCPSVNRRLSLALCRLWNQLWISSCKFYFVRSSEIFWYFVWSRWTYVILIPEMQSILKKWHNILYTHVHASWMPMNSVNSKN